MVERSVLGMKLQCKAVISNCDCELFTRNLHCDAQISNNMMLKMAILCREGSGTLRQQILMMH